MNRQYGFYWVKYRGTWVVANWLRCEGCCLEVWNITESPRHKHDSDFEDIDEDRILYKGDVSIGDPDYDGKAMLLVYTAGEVIRTHSTGQAGELGICLRTAMQNDREVRRAALGAVVDFCIAEGIDLDGLVKSFFPDGYKPMVFGKDGV